jgi:hypothetical protein
MFENTARDYHELNVGAHRKPPKILAAPSLIWHLAFWTNFQERDAFDQLLTNEDDSPKKKSSLEIKRALDQYILALRSAIGDVQHADEQTIGGKSARTGGVALSPCISGTHLLFGDAYREETLVPVECRDLELRQRDIFMGTNRAVSLHFVWKQLDVTIRFEVHTEFISMSMFVELDRNRRKAKQASHPLQAWYSQAAEFNQHIDALGGYLEPDMRTGQLVAESPASERTEKPQASADDGKRHESLNEYFFHRFWSQYEAEILAKVPITEFIKAEIFADFRGFVISDQAVQFSDDHFFEQGREPRWGHEAKSKLLPLIERHNREEHVRYECAANYMLDGHALYMSTLGPQSPSGSWKQRIPVEFIIYAHQRRGDRTVVNKWQLGRLVNQILLLGTLRLCALKDVSSLHEAGRQLSLLDQSMQRAREAIASTEDRAQIKAGKSGSPTREGEQATGAESVMELIGTAHRKLNEITGIFLKKTASGLLYRIERSRYYVKQFEENVKLLRIKRLEGDQPYDQFIRRRLGSEFDFIDRLGIRYERATRNMVTLDQNYLSMKANQIDEDIHAIQKYGEFVLLAALVPYYVTHLAVLVLGEEKQVLVAVNVWIVSIAAAIARNYRLWERTRRYFSRIEVLFAAAILVALAGYFIVGPVEGVILNYQHEQNQKRMREAANQQVEAFNRFSEAKQKSEGAVSPALPGPVAVPEASPPGSGPTAPTSDPVTPAPPKKDGD